MKVVTNWKLVGSLYNAEKSSDTVIIVAIWAPNVRDVDSLRNASILTEAGYDVFVPDYYWFCRSKWMFTPMNSIKTLLDSKKLMMNWVLQNVYEGWTIQCKYKRCIFLWLSYGWFAVLMLPKFDNSITEIAAFYPVVDYGSFGKRWVKEETVEDFLNALKLGFSPVYRGINLAVWDKQFSDQAWLSPLFNLEYMKDVNLFLAHWTQDTSIYYKKTAEYYEKLKTFFNEWKFVYNQYEWCEHGSQTMIPATYDLLKYLKESNK